MKLKKLKNYRTSMKKISMYMFCLWATSSCAQSDQTIVQFMNENLSQLSLSYILFFESELIECCGDSLHRKDFEIEIARQKAKIASEEMNEVKERQIFLHLLYNRISETTVSTPSQVKTKEFLMSQLSDFKSLKFTVDDEFIIDRLNPQKRGLPFGDEECDVDFSYYVFFLYDPKLYVHIMKTNRIVNPSGKVKFPISCYLEELSSVPVEMKKRVQQEVLKMLEGFEGQEFEDLRNKIKRANLNATFD